jgi:aromatic-L-amino-acid decarboxylase
VIEDTDSPNKRSEPPASLDPSDWNAFRELAHAALDEAIDFVKSVRNRPLWQPVTESVKAKLAEPLPAKPQGIESVYRDFIELVLPYALGNIHPRFFGWVHGAGLPSGIIAEIMAASMNLNCGGRSHVGIDVERTVIEWCKSIFGFPGGATGLVVSGTSMANLIGLTVARNARAPGDIRNRGLRSYPKTLVAYASAEVHESVSKAGEILGLGSEGLRKVQVNRHCQIDMAALRRAVSEDRQAGLEPFCVVGTAGTVNTGAIDDLKSLASFCREQELWFHVDGAFGALAVLSEEIRPRLRGIEMADSLAFDFHKWMHVQYDAGCVLVRNGKQHRSTFCTDPSYLHRTNRGLASGEEWPCDLGPELSRGFRALKVWFALKEYGAESFACAITRNHRQAQYLAKLVQHSPNIVLLNSPSLSIVCFRFYAAGWDDNALDCLNEDVVADLQESGIAAPSTTRIHGNICIRVNITNHRTRDDDLDLLVGAAVDAANKRFAAPG